MNTVYAAQPQSTDPDIATPTDISQAQWLNNVEQATSLWLRDLSVTICVKVKNNKDHVQYFKLTNTYYVTPETGTNTSNVIDFNIDWTDPPAVKMVQSAYPNLGGDYGWGIAAKDTKKVSFGLSAIGLMGGVPTYIVNLDAVDNVYWPLVPESGMYASWFWPNELEMLNPSLQILSWTGTFSFVAENHDSETVYGILRAPIVPLDSKLTKADPPVTYLDDEIVSFGNVAAWNVAMPAGSSRRFTYTYQWPYTSRNTTASSYSPPSVFATSNNTTPTVPTKSTGVPYGLFAMGALVTAAGVVYAKMIRR